MKKFFTGVTITMLIAATFLLLGTTLNAQVNKSDKTVNQYIHKETKEDVRVNIKVYLQDLEIETDNVEFSLYSAMSKKSHTIYLNNDFTVYLRPDTEYILTFTHVGFNKRSVIINTSAPDKNRYIIDLNMRLYNDQPGGIAGLIKYNKDIDNFESVGNIQNTTK